MKHAIRGIISIIVFASVELAPIPFGVRKTIANKMLIPICIFLLTDICWYRSWQRARRIYDLCFGGHRVHLVNGRFWEGKLYLRSKGWRNLSAISRAAKKPASGSLTGINSAPGSVSYIRTTYDHRDGSYILSVNGQHTEGIIHYTYAWREWAIYEINGIHDFRYRPALLGYLVSL